MSNECDEASAPPEQLPSGDVEQRSFVLDALAAAAGTAVGEGLRDGIRIVAHKLTPPPGRHEREREPPTDDGHDSGQPEG